jgi:hypothetical protein
VRLYCFENRLNCCEVRKVGDDDDNNNYYYYYSIPIYYRANLTEQQSIIKPIQHNQNKNYIIISLGNTGLCISGRKLSGPPGNPDYQTPDYRRTTVADVSKNRSALILRVKQSQKNRLILLALGKTVHHSTWRHNAQDL